MEMMPVHYSDQAGAVTYHCLRSVVAAKPAYHHTDELKNLVAI